MTYKKNTNKKPMKHISFVLPESEREAFRYFCFVSKLTPSEALRSMVRNLLYGSSLGSAIGKEADK